MNPETDFPEQRFQAGQVLLVGPEPSAVARGIREVRFQQGRPIIALDGIDTMDDAESLAGTELWADADGMEPLPENTFYHHDLVGCEVVESCGRVVGMVTAVEGPLERSHLLVESARGEVMIPLAAEIVAVDLPAKRIVVNPPQGLLELNEPRQRWRGQG